MRIVYFLFGYVDVLVNANNCVDVLNLCMYYAIPYTNFKCCDDGGISLRFKLVDYKRIAKECTDRCIEICKLREGGIPKFLYDHRKRVGIIVGLICAVFMVVYFDSFLWDVKISGNKTVTSSEIMDILEGYGVRVGAIKGKIDTADIENKILIERDDISWVSINIQGNIADVQVRENVKGKENIKTKFANVVANKSGVIEYTQIYNGNVVVRAGQYVNEGDLLISGIYDSKRVGFRFTRAAGSVFARTTQEICVKIPLEYEEKEYNGAVNYEKSLNFFGFSLKISKKVWNSGELYDTINRVEECSLGESVKLPVYISKTAYHEYTYVNKNRSEEEAQSLAYFELNRKIQALGDVDIIKKSITTSVSDSHYILVCTLTCIEDISRVSEFDVDLSLRD